MKELLSPATAISYFKMKQDSGQASKPITKLKNKNLAEQVPFHLIQLLVILQKLTVDDQISNPI